jgi:hypothetical protein
MKLKDTLLSLLTAGIISLAPKLADGAALDQWVYPDGAWATIFKPDNTDSVKTQVGEHLPNFWTEDLPAGWGVGLGDSGKVRLDTQTDTSEIKWFCTGASDLLPTSWLGI